MLSSIHSSLSSPPPHSSTLDTTATPPNSYLSPQLHPSPSRNCMWKQRWRKVCHLFHNLRGSLIKPIHPTRSIKPDNNDANLHQESVSYLRDIPNLTEVSLPVSHSLHPPQLVITLDDGFQYDAFTIERAHILFPSRRKSLDMSSVDRKRCVRRRSQLSDHSITLSYDTDDNTLMESERDYDSMIQPGRIEDKSNNTEGSHAGIIHASLNFIPDSYIAVKLNDNQFRTDCDLSDPIGIENGLTLADISPHPAPICDPITENLRMLPLTLESNKQPVLVHP